MNSTPPSIHDQAAYWDRWNAESREQKLVPSSLRQWEVIDTLLRSQPRRDLSIIDVGCGTGWTCERLREFGQVTGTDMVEQVIERAKQRLPDVQFVCGDFFEIELAAQSFDVVVCLEVLSHVDDQRTFMRRVASLLKPNGLLILCTQNRWVLERWDAVAPPDPKQIRHWLDGSELKQLLVHDFTAVKIRSLYPVGNRGLLRVANSVKVNALGERLLGKQRLIRWKEQAGFGHTLFASARRRPTVNA